jgi:dUTP pyrophosphatase
MKVKFKKVNPEAVTPSKAEEYSAGFDLTAISKDKVYCKDTGNLKYISYDFGLAMEIPENHVGLIFPRSSISKYNMDLSNSVGVIDSSYRGSISARFRQTGSSGVGEYNIGDKVAQIIILPYPKIDFVESDELTDSKRGDKGFGSSDDKTYYSKSGAW